ncbi:hypothetical protein HZ326_16667 [Fusarium oxysporum f. sp. albedinis]|nr:hypothetical protein HZ326_16667 [Fusarium oxysporum f. sp. albedinis]
MKSTKKRRKAFEDNIGKGVAGVDAGAGADAVAGARGSSRRSRSGPRAITPNLSCRKVQGFIGPRLENRQGDVRPPNNTVLIANSSKRPMTGIIASLIKLSPIRVQQYFVYVQKDARRDHHSAYNGSCISTSPTDSIQVKVSFDFHVDTGPLRHHHSTYSFTPTQLFDEDPKTRNGQTGIY